MPGIRETRRLPYSCEEMFDLVADVDFLTMGQYLQPTPKHAKVEEFISPQAFDAYGSIARAKGFLQVAASPLTRSSYHAGDDFARLRAARAAQLET